MITKIKKDIRTFETDCPLFFGFYGTHLGAMLEGEADKIIEEDWLNINQVVFDFDTAYSEVSELYVNEIERTVKSDIGIDIQLEFVELHSPRFYNFSNDRAFVKMTVDVEEVLSMCMASKEDVSKYVKENFTSVSGFTSFVPNNFNEWIEVIRSEGDRWELMVSELLTFLLTLSGVEESHVVEWITGNFYIDYEIIDQ